ncbi:Lipase 5 [Coniothyrium glycines]
MSLLSDTVLAGGSTRLHTRAAQDDAQQRRLRKSRSHAGLVTARVQELRNLLGSAVSNYRKVPGTTANAVSVDRRPILYLRMKDAGSYDEWKAAAAQLDLLEGNNLWKEQDDSPEYDAALVAARLSQLDDARLSCDVKRMLFLIRTALTRGLGDMGHLRLYKHSHTGTKKLTERYIESAQKTIAALLDVSAKQGDQCPVDPQQLKDELLRARQSFGRSALLLSGGGTLGMNHIGVVKCLWDARLLPRIISGASAGSIVCAVLCTRTDEEIPEILHEFCYGDLNVFGPPDGSENVVHKAVRLLQSGAFFDIGYLKRVMRGLMGDMTFQEAYNRTRRILNIPVSTSSLYELPRLLNYVTAPNVIIWSAVCASCSVPLVYQKASLLAKDPLTGGEVPWDSNPDATWIDGSVDNDLPMARLAEIFNVNHFIVSQVNPHVVPFLAKEEEIIAEEAHHKPTNDAGPSWVSNSVDLAKGELLHRLQQVADAGVLPNWVLKMKSILSQQYSGDINIFPQISYADFPRVLSNPTTEYMIGCMLKGQRATWPKLARIQNHVAIELALDDACHKMSERVVFAPTQAEVRVETRRSNLQGNNPPRPQRTRSMNKIPRFELRMQPPSPLLRRSAPTSPLLSRSVPRMTPRIDGTTTSTEGRTTLDLISSSNDTSDQDYFADPDTDTTDAISSPSPLTSPNLDGPAIWPSTRPPPLQNSTQPTEPHVSTAADIHVGTLLNLTMTPAQPTQAPAPSSPELLYKSLFHPSGPVAPDPNQQRFR